MSKFEDVRIVTFKEDYAVPRLDKDGNPTDQKIVYYKKDSVHAMHYSVAEKLQKKGVKMTVEKFDRDAYVKREKEKRLKKDKPNFSVERR